MLNKPPLFFLAVILIGLISLNACAPSNDTTDPVIILLGTNPYNVDSIGGGFTEPGFTAVDDNDGDISDRVTVQFPVITTDSAKSYQVFYSVKDNEGNVFTTYRVINIRNTSTYLEGVYNHDTLFHATDSVKIFQSSIVSNTVTNGNFSIYNFANKGASAIVKGSVDFSGNLTFQTPVNLMDSDSTVILSTFNNTLLLKSPSKLEINFYLRNDTIVDSIPCRIIMAR